MGLIIAAGTLGVLAWADNAYGDVVARTMGVTTFSLFRLFSSLETADENESVFGGSILGNRPLLIGTAMSIVTIILATELPFFQRILGTVNLSIDQWVVCLLVPLSLVVAEEARKLLKIRTDDEPALVAAPAAA
jgi:Ca2+-transporting ATPase